MILTVSGRKLIDFESLELNVSKMVVEIFLVVWEHQVTFPLWFLRWSTNTGFVSLDRGRKGMEFVSCLRERERKKE